MHRPHPHISFERIGGYRGLVNITTDVFPRTVSTNSLNRWVPFLDAALGGRAVTRGENVAPAPSVTRGRPVAGSG